MFCDKKSLLKMPPRRTKNAFKKESFRQNYFFNLNDEELAMIFKYLKDLKHVSLVCKKFHKVVVSMIQGKQWLWIKNEEDVSVSVCTHRVTQKH